MVCQVGINNEKEYKAQGKRRESDRGGEGWCLKGSAYISCKEGRDHANLLRRTLLTEKIAITC